MPHAHKTGKMDSCSNIWGFSLNSFILVTSYIIPVFLVAAPDDGISFLILENVFSCPLSEPGCWDLCIPDFSCFVVLPVLSNSCTPNSNPALCIFLSAQAEGSEDAIPAALLPCPGSWECSVLLGCQMTFLNFVSTAVLPWPPWRCQSKQTSSADSGQA